MKKLEIQSLQCNKPKQQKLLWICLPSWHLARKRGARLILQLSCSPNVSFIKNAPFMSYHFHPIIFFTASQVHLYINQKQAVRFLFTGFRNQCNLSII